MRWIGRALLVSVGLAMTVWSSLAGAQEIPCSAEIGQYCADVQPGGGRLLQCLTDHRAQLSAACTQRVEEMRTMLAGPLGACRDDWVAFCYHARSSGASGFVPCLRSHEQEVSPSCKKALQNSMPAKRDRGEMP